MSINPGHPFHQYLETIFQKVPAELKDKMNRRQLPDDTPLDVPSEKTLIRLHRNVIITFRLLYYLAILLDYFNFLIDNLCFRPSSLYKRYKEQKHSGVFW